MNLTPVEWSQAQDLLVKLVQVLTPLTEPTVPASFFLSRRFVIPSDEVRSPSIQHTVRLLPQLQFVQEQVAKWIAETPQEVAKKETEAPPQALPPLSKQAQQLVRQVQSAIAALAKSSYIQDPQEAPLRDVLKKLKPYLDQIIHAMTHEQESPQASSSAFRQALPRSPREQHIIKPPKEGREPVATHSQTAQPTVPEVPKKTPLPAACAAPRVIERKERGEKFATPKEEAPTPSEKKKMSVMQEEKAIPQAMEKIDKHSRPEGKSEVKAPFKSFEPIALPAAPFVHQTKNITAPHKKKKRRGFWYKGEEDPEERNDS